MGELLNVLNRADNILAMFGDRGSIPEIIVHKGIPGLGVFGRF